MIPVQDLNNLYFFAKVVDFGSYTAAAKALGLQTRCQPPHRRAGD